MNKVLASLLMGVLLVGGGTAYAERLTLPECLQLARQRNLNLQAERINPQFAEEQVRETRSVFLPQVDLDAGYTAQAHAQEVLLDGRSAPTQDQDYAHLSVNAEQLLYDFGRSDARLNAAKARAQVAESGEKKTSPFHSLPPVSF